MKYYIEIQFKKIFYSNLFYNLIDLNNIFK